jgi:rRNA-processing protein FCF1
MAGFEAARNFQNAVLDQQYQIDLENYNNQVVQEKTLRKLKDKQNLQQYEYQTAVKEAQEQAQEDAYVRSNEVYDNNLKSIDFYAGTARSRVQLGLDEQIAQLSFQMDDLDNDFARRAAAAAFADTGQQQIIDNAKENAGLAKEELEIQRTEGKAQFDAKFANIEAQETKLSNDINIEQNRIRDLYDRGGIKETELKKFGLESKAAQKRFEIGQEQAKAFDIESTLKTGQLGIRESELDYLKYERASKEGELDIRTEALGKFDIEKTAALGQLGVREKGLEGFDIEQRSRLGELDIREQGLEKLSIEERSKLGELGIREDALESLSIEERSKLGELSIREDALEKFDIERESTLGELGIREKGIKEFNQEKRRLQTESRYSQLNNQLESMMKAGAAKATGLKGRSANKVINSIAAFNGLNSQKLNDSLYQAIESVELKKSLEKQRIDLQRKTAERDTILRKSLEEQSIALGRDITTSDIALRRSLEERGIELGRDVATSDIALRKSLEEQGIALGKDIATSDITLKKSLEKEGIKIGKNKVIDSTKLEKKLAKDGIKLDTKFLKNTFDLKQSLEKSKVELEKTATSADIALRKSVQKQLNNLEKSTADKDIALRKKLQEKANKLDETIAQKTLDARKTFEESTLSIRKTLAEAEEQSFLDLMGAGNVKSRQITAGQQQTTAAAKSKQDEIAQALGVDAQELSLSKEKLAESIMSAGESAKIQLEEIENKSFEAKTQSFAQRMLKPRFGPALPEPFKTPKTEYIEPKLPIYHTKGSVKAGGASARVPQSSGLSTALGIGSAALAIAAPFTGGATAGILGGLSAGTGFLSGLFK